MIAAEVSLYPIEAKDADTVINTCLAELTKSGLDCTTNEVSTHVHGESEALWKGLQALFETATKQGGEVSMVVTVTNGKH